MIRRNLVLWLLIAVFALSTLWLLAGAVVTIVDDRAALEGRVDAAEERVTELERVDNSTIEVLLNQQAQLDAIAEKEAP